MTHFDVARRHRPGCCAGRFIGILFFHKTPIYLAKVKFCHSLKEIANLYLLFGGLSWSLPNREVNSELHYSLFVHLEATQATLSCSWWHSGVLRVCIKISLKGLRKGCTSCTTNAAERLTDYEMRWTCLCHLCCTSFLCSRINLLYRVDAQSGRWLGAGAAERQHFRDHCWLADGNREKESMRRDKVSQEVTSHGNSTLASARYFHYLQLRVTHRVSQGQQQRTRTTFENIINHV